MRKKFPICCLLLAGICMLSACKKDYDCQCTNSNGTYIAGTITNTKMQAKKQCQNLSTGSTTCTLK